MRKFLCIMFAAMLMLSVFPFTVSAESTDTMFYIDIDPQVVRGSTFAGMRKKDNTTSSYVKSEIGVYKFIAVIYGSADRLYGEYTDCTTYEIYSGSRRSDAVVTRGTKGYVRQDVYERYGAAAWAQIHGKCYNGQLGFVEGKWSPDSVYESGCVYYN